MKRLMAVAGLILLVGCQAPPAEMTEAEIAQIEAEVSGLAEAWLSAWETGGPEEYCQATQAYLHPGHVVPCPEESGLPLVRHAWIGRSRPARVEPAGAVDLVDHRAAVLPEERLDHSSRHHVGDIGVGRRVTPEHLEMHGLPAERIPTRDNRVTAGLGLEAAVADAVAVVPERAVMPDPEPAMVGIELFGHVSSLSLRSGRPSNTRSVDMEKPRPHRSRSRCTMQPSREARRLDGEDVK